MSAIMDGVQFEDMQTQLKSAEWKWFLASTQRDKNNRRDAKCKQCDKVLAGRVESMKRHLLHECKRLSATDRAIYIRETQPLLSNEKVKSSQASAANNNQQSSEAAMVVSRKRPAAASISQYFPMNVSGGRKKALDEKLLEAMIVGNVQFNFVECPQFREYAALLGHQLPSRRTISGPLLQDMFARHYNDMLEELSTVNDLTILLDGWTDVSGNSIYAYIGQTRDFVLDICHLKQRPSADQIRSQMFEVLNSLHLSTRNILAITTDTPHVMEKLRRDVSNEYPNILGIKCGLHIINLSIQRALKHDVLMDIFKKNQTIVNFFKSSHYWLSRLRDWMEENGVRKGLQTYTATRWYSAVQVAMSVEGVEEGLMVCLGEGFATQNPLPQKVSSILQTPGHSTRTRLLVRLLKPLTDAIARLEKLSSSLDQTFIAIITSYRQVQQVAIEHEYQPWRVAVQSAISSVAKRFNHPLYFVALFLNPQWQTVALSRKYNAESITKEVLILAKNFGFSKVQCIQIKSDIADYLALVQARGKWDDSIDAWSWWNQQLRCQQLRLLALKLLTIRPHTAAVERLFSSLGLTKTTSRNRLGVEKLKMMALIRTRIQVQEEKRRSTRLFPSNERAMEPVSKENEGEEGGEGNETINEETTEVETESLQVEDEEESEQDREDKTLVEVFFNIETYNQPLNTEQEEAEDLGDESDFSI